MMRVVVSGVFLQGMWGRFYVFEDVHVGLPLFHWLA
jgi:hypothetical protein